jgi:hypothetical protein
VLGVLLADVLAVCGCWNIDDTNEKRREMRLWGFSGGCCLDKDAAELELDIGDVATAAGFIVVVVGVAGGCANDVPVVAVALVLLVLLVLLLLLLLFEAAAVAANDGEGGSVMAAAAAGVPGAGAGDDVCAAGVSFILAAPFNVLSGTLSDADGVAGAGGFTTAAVSGAVGAVLWVVVFGFLTMYFLRGMSDALF